MTSKSYALIVFDWDGTLMDSEAKIVNAMQAAIADVVMPFRSREQIKDIIGLGLQEALSALFDGIDEAQSIQLIDAYRHHFLFADETPMPMFEGVGRLLETLNKQAYWLAVATGKSRKGLDRVLDECNLRHYFHVTRCADECFSKPHPLMMEEIMAFVGVTSNETLMVGDSEYDMLMAKNAGVDALAVSYGVHEKKRLLDCGALGCLDDIRELHDWLPGEK
ncbi:MAG: HAD-IA family hydrolase [Gammaproteobacteria bacterium]|nr:HAD-IA family hydrolase [Gammaproteobacteria bacterium]MCF6229376.1 HAD-IA family hydrolase [Gammaproteobacteria bacterium]